MSDIPRSSLIVQHLWGSEKRSEKLILHPCYGPYSYHPARGIGRGYWWSERANKGELLCKGVAVSKKLEDDYKEKDYA